MTRLHLGIDPGASGGLACIDQAGAVVAAYAMPPTNPEILHLLATWAALAPARGASLHAVIEGVHAHPKQGVRSVWTFGVGYGGLLMALDAAAIEFAIVYPIKWQNRLQCRSGGDKNVTKAAAAAMFPDMRVTHAIADALLLAEYSRQVYANPGGA